MKNFFKIKAADMTVGQTLLYIALVYIVAMLALVVALMMPQACESIFDWVEDQSKKLKRWFKERKARKIA